MSKEYVALAIVTALVIGGMVWRIADTTIPPTTRLSPYRIDTLPSGTPVYCYRVDLAISCVADK